MFTSRNLFWLIAWATALYGALSVSNLSGDWDHSVCGPWGCGPPIQALVGCHLAWIVLLSPLALSVGPMRNIPAGNRLRIGKALICVSMLLLGGVVAYQTLAWWPNVSEWQQRFLWQRLGFVIVTTVDVPMLQILVAGVTVVWRARFPTPPPVQFAYSPEAGEVRLQ